MPSEPTDRERQLERALLIIEGLFLESSGDHIGHPGKAPAGFTTEGYIMHLQGLASDAYCIAHAGSGRCCKGGLGDPFQVRADERAKFLKAAGIVDVDKILSRGAARRELDWLRLVATSALRGKLRTHLDMLEIIVPGDKPNELCECEWDADELPIHSDALEAALRVALGDTP